MPILIRFLRSDNFTYSPSQSTINYGKAQCYAPVTSVRLQFRVTSPGVKNDSLFFMEDGVKVFIKRILEFCGGGEVKQYNLYWSV